MPPETRPALWALYAFNHEIAKTREVVTETTIGLIRLQWWRDALAKIYEEDVVLQNEVLPELHEAIRAHDLPRADFEALTYAREFDLENVAPSSLEGLENYAEYTNAPLLKLALKIAGQAEDEETVQRVAVAYGLTGLLRAAAFHKAQGRDYMPADLMAAQEMRAVVKTIADRGRALLQVKPQSRMLRAHRRLSLLYLKQVETLDYDLFAARMGLPPAFFHLRFVLWPL